MNNPPENQYPGGGAISDVDDNLLQNILSKLPAKSFASAACVNRSWNEICTRILSHPIFLSALSLNSSLPEAVNEVTCKVLSAPIRPHFAILSICPTFCLDEAHLLITQNLGSRIPIITCEAGGIIGRNALNDQFSEVRFPYYNDDFESPKSGGISLTVGYLPGLKVDVVPLLYTEQGPSIDKFVMDLRSFSASVSGCTSPEAIIMFGDSQADMKPVLEKLDYALSQQTVVAGNGSCSFRHSSINQSKIISTRGKELACEPAVALVFVRERTTMNGLGKIEFHFAVGDGVTAVGPTYRVASAKMRTHEFSTWLTAKREGENVILDGEEILNDFEREMEDIVPNYDLYIGVRKRRKYSIGSEQVKPLVSLAYHPVQEGDEQYLYVGGWDIKTGDTFQLYIPDREYALASCGNVSENFGKLKHKEIIGGIIGGFVFACCGRGEMFFEKSNVDSSPILDNFPGVPLGGMFCGAEIGRGSPNLGPCDNGQEQASTRSYLHVYSSIYLLMSYSVPSSSP